MRRSQHGATSRARWAAIGAALAVSLGAGGIAVTHAVVDSGEKSVFVPIAPCRLFDMRTPPSQVGPRSTPLGAGETYTQPVIGDNGNCLSIPADATGVAMNVTAVGGTAAGYLTIWPSDVTPMPVASNLNWVAGSPPTPNKVDVQLSADGKINLFNSAGTVSVLADVVGYYADHNHDDRYYTKAESDAQAAVEANAADVYTKAQINGMPSSSVVAGGSVASDGTLNAFSVRFGATWTSSRPFAGTYVVSIPGLNPGCQDPLLPMVVTTGIGFSPGVMQTVGGSVSCGNGNSTVQINAFDDAGASADIAFQFVAYRPGNNQLLPTSAHTGATECTVHPDGTVECV